MMLSTVAEIQSTSQGSCEEANQPQNLYHMNWSVLAKRIECPTDLAVVTGCKLQSQGLPTADPTAIDASSAAGKGFTSGYTSTTQQDCCRSTCSFGSNVTGAAPGYPQIYSCDATGSTL